MKELDEDQRRERRGRRTQLMVQWQRGDPEACKALLDDIGPSLMYFLRRRVADPHELEDVYQEVFMAVFEARHTYQPQRPFEPWLFAIARNIAVDYSNRHWSRARWQELVAEPPERLLEELTAGAPDLGAALAKLPSDQRDAFAMLKLHGLSLEAASVKTGITVGALKARAHRAYKALKRLLRE